VLVPPQDVTIGHPRPECRELAAWKLNANVEERLEFEDAAGGTLAARGADARRAGRFQPTAQRAALPASPADNTIVFDRGRDAVITTSGRSLDATADLSNAARPPASDGGSRCVHPEIRAGSVAMKKTTTPDRSFAHRMTHYLLAPYSLYERSCGAKFGSDTIVHTMLTFRRSRLTLNLVRSDPRQRCGTTLAAATNPTGGATDRAKALERQRRRPAPW
jgi:hypothetical protein